ncbi:MAG: DUF5683 domain-containing protein [Bacteroides sp.]|nr:DUF5683 domain-containing protein [Bacteroides sp.]
MSIAPAYHPNASCTLRGTARDRGFAWRYAGGLFVLLLLALPLFSQTPLPDQPQRSPEALPIDTLPSGRRIPSPGRAAMLSATLPGLGQAYNRAYWKIPIIYAGFGGVAYAVNFNNDNYQEMRRAYLAKVDGNPNTPDNYPLYTDASLKRAMEYYRRNLELSFILGAALYLLNILDANVQAHLMDFDVSEDISMKIEPRMDPSPALAGPVSHLPALKFTFRF